MKKLLVTLALVLPFASAFANADVIVEYTFSVTGPNIAGGGPVTFIGRFTVNQTLLARQGSNANGTNGACYGYGGTGHDAITAFSGVATDAEGNTLCKAGLDNVGAYYLRLSNAFDPDKNIQEQVVGLNGFSIHLDSPAYHFAPITAAHPTGIFIACIRTAAVPKSSS